MGCPGGHAHDPIYSLSIYACFLGQFVLKFSYEKIIMVKKDRLAVFGRNNDRLFPVKFSFCLKSERTCLSETPWTSHNTP